MQSGSLYDEGLYTLSDITTMITVDGYVPVASATEFNKIRTTASSVLMGVGTPWEAGYATGVDKKYVQVRNVSLSIYSNFSTIGNFVGIYDGNLLDITDLTISGGTGAGMVFFGSAAGDKTWKNSKINGNVTGGFGTGVLCGVADKSDIIIENCIISGSVDSGSENVSGAIGQNSGTIKKCFSSVNATGNAYQGSLVGQNNSTGVIQNCYATGSATASVNYAGGLVGLNRGSITNCYSIGAVTLGGGLIGLQDGGTTTDSYWDTVTSGQSTSAGGTGKTTTELQADAIGTGIYSNWSTLIWEKEVNEYPTLINNA